MEGLGGERKVGLARESCYGKEVIYVQHRGPTSFLSHGTQVKNASPDLQLLSLHN